MTGSKLGRVALLVAIAAFAAVPVGSATAAWKDLAIGTGEETATIQMGPA